MALSLSALHHRHPSLMWSGKIIQKCAIVKYTLDTAVVSCAAPPVFDGSICILPGWHDRVL